MRRAALDASGRFSSPVSYRGAELHEAARGALRRSRRARWQSPSSREEACALGGLDAILDAGVLASRVAALGRGPFVAPRTAGAKPFRGGLGEETPLDAGLVRLVVDFHDWRRPTLVGACSGYRWGPGRGEVCVRSLQKFGARGRPSRGRQGRPAGGAIGRDASQTATSKELTMRRATLAGRLVHASRL